MVEVTGQFKVQLRTPITVDFDFSSAQLNEIRFNLDGKPIELSPLEFDPPFIDEEGELIEWPKIVKMSVRVTKNVEKLNGSPPTQKLPAKERRKFEPIINLSIGRLTALIKRRTGQWHLDHRLPVYSYSASFFYRGRELPEEIPLEGERWVIPEEVSGIISWNLDDVQDDLTIESWNQMCVEIQDLIELDHYEEAIFDAKTFRGNLNYDAAVLYAAFAAETILKEISMQLLTKKGGLEEEQIIMLLEGLNNPRLIRLVESLIDSELPRFNNQKLIKLFELRNDIVHKRKSGVTSRQASAAIRVADQLRKAIEGAS